MSLPFEPVCLPLLLGSLPHRNVTHALEATRRYAGALLAWPQLPQLGAREQSVVQGVSGFPGLVFKGETLSGVDRARAQGGLNRLALAYLENDASYAALTPEHAAGLTALLSHPDAVRSVRALKGQQLGPISLAATLIDEQQCPLIYDERLFEALTQYVRLRATWQEHQLGELNGTTIICIDEPFLEVVGQPFLPIDWDEARLRLDEVFEGIAGCKALYAGGAVAWAQVLGTRVELIIADVYVHGAALVAAAEPLAEFIARDGLVGLGIVPADPDALRYATVEGLLQRIAALLAALAAGGVAPERLLRQAVITTSDGLGQLDVPMAERALQLVQQVSSRLREQHQLNET